MFDSHSFVSVTVPTGQPGQVYQSVDNANTELRCVGRIMYRVFSWLCGLSLWRTNQVSVLLSHRCSWDKFLNCMLTIFPFLRWICLYRFKEWLLGDLLAGISVGLVQIPQGKEESKPFHPQTYLTCQMCNSVWLQKTQFSLGP